nr:C-type lectin [Vipera transcaucasiana]
MQRCSAGNTSQAVTSPPFTAKKTQLSLLSTLLTISKVGATSGSDCGVKRKASPGSGQMDRVPNTYPGSKISPITTQTKNSALRLCTLQGIACGMIRTAKSRMLFSASADSKAHRSFSHSGRGEAPGEVWRSNEAQPKSMLCIPSLNGCSLWLGCGFAHPDRPEAQINSA